MERVGTDVRWIRNQGLKEPSTTKKFVRNFEWEGGEGGLTWNEVLHDSA